MAELRKGHAPAHAPAAGSGALPVPADALRVYAPGISSQTRPPCHGFPPTGILKFQAVWEVGFMIEAACKAKGTTGEVEGISA
jgi:hypothetical protein